MGFDSIKQMVESELNGSTRYIGWRKAPIQITTKGVWFDLSMSPGNPVPQYYAAAPLVSIALKQSTDGGLYHGPSVSPSGKYIRQIMAMANTAAALPMPMILLDYLLYYPFIDEGTTDEQLMTNTVPLSRYTDGAGVQIMAVSVASRTGGQSFTVKYTNQSGVSGRVSKTVVQNTAAANGHIVTSATATNGAAGPFIPLQNGDTGVRYIESVTMNGTDVGLFTLVLVKPLLQMQIRGIDAPVEVDPFMHKAAIPKIEDDAYLNFICLPNGSITGTTILGDLKTVWN